MFIWLGQVEGVLCDGASPENIASTVVDCTKIETGHIGFFRVGLIPKSKVIYLSPLVFILNEWIRHIRTFLNPATVVLRSFKSSRRSRDATGQEARRILALSMICQTHRGARVQQTQKVRSQESETRHLPRHHLHQVQRSVMRRRCECCQMYVPQIRCA